jgi:hypothetical protein
LATGAQRAVTGIISEPAIWAGQCRSIQVAEAGVTLPSGFSRGADEAADGIPGHSGLSGRSDGLDDTAFGTRALRNRMPHQLV